MRRQRRRYPWQFRPDPFRNLPSNIVELRQCLAVCNALVIRLQAAAHENARLEHDLNVRERAVAILANYQRQQRGFWQQITGSFAPWPRDILESAKDIIATARISNPELFNSICFDELVREYLSRNPYARGGARPMEDVAPTIVRRIKQLLGSDLSHVDIAWFGWGTEELDRAVREHHVRAVQACELVFNGRISKIQVDEIAKQTRESRAAERERKRLARELLRPASGRRDQSDKPTKPTIDEKTFVDGEARKSARLSQEKTRREQQYAAAAAHLGKTRRRAARFRVKLRNQQLTISATCPYCGTPMDRTSVLDHIYPVSKGGLSTERNLVFICLQCNDSKRDRTLREFVKEFQLDWVSVEEALERLGKDF